MTMQPKYDRTSIIVYSVLSLIVLSGTTEVSTQEHECGTHHCHLLGTVQSQLNQLREKLNELSDSPYASWSLPKSCTEIKKILPDSPSDYYNIRVSGVNQTVYCNMDELCGENGGWMRVGHLNMTDNNQTCPPGFQTYNTNGIRSCGRSSAYCQSAKLPSHGVSYTRVCGRVTGYQKGSTDAFNLNFNNQRGNIETAYVDGVSITKGSSRNHIWSFVSSLSETNRWCPCDEGSTKVSPSFVGEDYFCETALDTWKWDLTTLHTNDLLWDGKHCGTIQVACCERMPWFKKVLDVPSNDCLELRVCGDEGLGNEDVGVNFYDIFIK